MNLFKKICIICLSLCLTSAHGASSVPPKRKNSAKLKNATAKSKELTAKKFLKQLSASLDSPQELKDIAKIYRDKLANGFAPRTESLINYWQVQYHIEKRTLPTAVLEDYKIRKSIFKDRIRLVSGKDPNQTLYDLDLYYAEFIKKFIATNQEYILEKFLEKIQKGEKPDSLDKTCFWMLYAGKNISPFEMKALEIEIKLIPLHGSGNFIILCGEKGRSEISYIPYYFDCSTKQIYRSNSDLGEPTQFTVSYDAFKKAMIKSEESCLACTYGDVTKKYAFNLSRKVWIKTAEELPIL